MQNPDSHSSHLKYATGVYYSLLDILRGRGEKNVVRYLSVVEELRRCCTVAQRESLAILLYRIEESGDLGSV